MKSKTNEYIAMFKMKLIEGFQYRAAALAGVATQFFFGILFLMIYYAYYSFSPDQPISFDEMVSYVWLQQAFLAMAMMWWQDNELLESITSGHVAYEFCRPYSLYEFWYARLLATRISSTLLRCGPILTITFFLPSPWNMKPPGSLASFFLFLASLCMGMLLATAVSMFIYISTFLTLSSSGSRMVISSLAEFFCGHVVPIPLLPATLQTVCYALPFAYSADIPFRIYSGNIPPMQALAGIGIQTVWVVVLFTIGRLCIGKISRRVVIQGG